MKMKLKAFLIWHKYNWQDKPEYSLNNSDMAICGPDYVAVNEQEFEVDIPDNFVPTPKQIAALKEQKAEILAKAHVQAENIEEQIQRLLCIEHKPESDQQ